MAKPVPKAHTVKPSNAVVVPPVKRKAAAFKPTGRTITNLRARLGLSKADFANAVGVSVATVTNWENAKGAVSPHNKGLCGLQRLHEQPSA